MALGSASLADTIVACATPPGDGALAVVRLSGDDALRIGRRLAGRTSPLESHRLVRASLRDSSGRPLDEGMVVEMHAPRSYTGEDVVELHVHGARSVVEAVQHEAHRLGARPAQAGEFTLRGFLNGRMDLAQAEAVGDLIVAGNDLQRSVASDQLKGGLSHVVEELIERLEAILVQWRACLDFPEEDDGNGSTSEQLRALNEIRCNIQGYLERSKAVVHRARRIVLCGAPNVGKSTLFNAWVGEERVLVDAEPGTTRDPVEIELSEGLIRWSVCDTAGIRDGGSRLEARGMAMALERVRDADVALWLVDPLRPEWPEEGLVVEVVGSKADLAEAARRREIEGMAAEGGRSVAAWVSAESGEGVSALRERLLGAKVGEERQSAAVVVRRRHWEALERADTALARVLEAVDREMTLDVLARDVEDSAKALGEILGRDVDAEVLDRIFSEFCIGK